MNKRRVGSKKEDEAARFLTGCGLVILEQNFSNRFGEIDLIAKDEDFIVFVEVKYRRNPAHGHPEEAVGISKARTISRVADHYRLYRKLSADTKFRFDVVAIEGDRIRWYRNAFSYMG